jgi:DNA repair exonuclease SbcCD ATPase subunit
MEKDARDLLELLAPAVERAERVEAQHKALLERHEDSAEAFADKVNKAVRDSERERSRLEAADKQHKEETQKQVAVLEESKKAFKTLEEEARARGQQEADAIIAAARGREAEARAAVEELRQKQAVLEAEHAERMAQAEHERAEAEAAHRARLNEADAAHQARLAELEARGLAAVEEREREFEGACAAERDRLQALADKEAEVQARVAEMRRLAAADGPSAPVELVVGGCSFETNVGCLTRFEKSVLATAWHAHRAAAGEGGAGGGPLRVDGDPTHFRLVLNFLRRPDQMPVVSDASQIQWLEREADFLHLDELVQLCRDA